MDNEQLTKIGKVIDIMRSSGLTEPQEPKVSDITPEIDADQVGFDGGFDISDANTNELQQALQSFIATPIQGADDDLISQLEEAGIGVQEDIGDIEGERRDLEREAGIRDLQAQRRDIVAQTAQLQAGLTAGLTAEEGRVVPLEVVTGRQAELQRQALVKAQSLQAIDAALQGNIQTAQAKIDDQINLKYSALENRLALIDRAIQSAERTFTVKENRLAEQRQNQISLLQTEIENKRADEKQAKELVLNLLKDEKISSGEASRLLSQDNLTAADVASSYGVGTQIDGSGNNIITPEINRAIENSLEGLEFGSVTERERAAEEMQLLLRDGDIVGAKEYLGVLIRKSASSAQQDTLDGKKTSILRLQEISELLDEFKAAGGDTGIFTGLKEGALRKIGKTQDPELAEIATKIGLTIIDYRKAVSGAAFTESEAKEYDRLFPSAGKTAELNDAVINALITTFESDTESFYKQRIGNRNFERIFTNTTQASDGLSDDEAYELYRQQTGGQSTLPGGQTPTLTF